MRHTDVMICAKCGSVGTPDKSNKGGCLIEFVLWCFFIVPGLIYTIWRRTGKANNICKSCGSAARAARLSGWQRTQQSIPVRFIAG